MDNVTMSILAVLGVVLIGIEIQIVRLEQRVKKMEGDKK